MVPSTLVVVILIGQVVMSLVLSFQTASTDSGAVGIGILVMGVLLWAKEN